MRRLIGLITALLSISVSALALEEVKVGNSTINVAPPSGYCEFDKARKTDSDWLATAVRLQAAGGITLIAAFAECKQLADFHAAGSFIATKILISAQTQEIGRASAQSVSDICRSLKEAGEKMPADMKSKMQQDLKNNTFTVLRDIPFLGVLEENAEVCYAAQVLDITIANGNAVKLLNIFVVALARDNLVYIYHSIPLVDATSVTTGLAKLKAVYADFAAANAK